MQSRLANANLAALPHSVARPAYDRNSLQSGIVHLGVGAFHRAHQAVYTEAVLNSGLTDWGIVGVSLNSPTTRDALAPQDGLFTVAVRDGGGTKLQVVGGLRDLLVASESPQRVLAALSAPETRIVSLTITEKGYCHRPATGTLDEQHPGILHDLAPDAAPITAIGFLVAAIEARRLAGVPPFTVLSCDNLPANGETLERIVRRFAEIRDPALARYVEDAVCFPSTMVDRIVPATTDADRALVEQALGLRDEWPIMTEPFTQWVVEDRFANGRPPWEEFGVTFAADVEPFELMKLRLLNGSHSTLAYLGYLAGHQTVDAAMAAPGFEPLLQTLMKREVLPTLKPMPDFNLDLYCASLLQRFKNPALKHRTWQIAMDGTQKIPQRLLGSIRDRIAAGQPYPALALGVAAWMRYVMGFDDAGQPIDVRDPLSADIAQRLAGTRDAHSVTARLLELGIFGADLPQNRGFTDAVTAALDRLLRNGAARAVTEFSLVQAP